MRVNPSESVDRSASRPGTVTKVAFFDRFALLCQSLCVVLKTYPDFDVQWVTDSADDALRLTQERRPHVLLVEPAIGADEAFELLRRLRDRHVATTRAVLSRSASLVFVRRGLENGIRGYLSKDQTLQSVVEGIRRLGRGEEVFSPEIRKQLTWDGKLGRYRLDPGNSMHRLTDRQVEVLAYVAQGASAKEIARALDLTVKAVNSHTYRIMRKLNIHDRVGLARFAIRQGIADP